MRTRKNRRAATRAVLICSAVLGATPLLVSGQNTTWTNQTGNGQWGDAANWTSGIPATDTFIRIAAAGDIDLGGQTRQAQNVTQRVAPVRFFNGTLRSDTYSFHLGTVFDCDVLVTTGRFSANSSADPETIQYNGVIREQGSIANVTASGVFNAANTYTGDTRAGQGTLVLRGNGSVLASRLVSISRGATLQLDNRATNSPSRIADGAPLSIGGTMQIRAGSVDSSEGVGTLSFPDLGNRLELMADDPATAVELRVSGLSRDVGDLLSIHTFDGGANRGLTSASTAIAIGGGLPADQSGVVPGVLFVQGVDAAARPTLAGARLESGAMRVRGLDLNTDYAQVFASAQPLTNVRTLTDQSIPAPTTINSLLAESGAQTTVDAASALTITSGAMLFWQQSGDARAPGLAGGGALLSPNELILSHVLAPSAPGHVAVIDAAISAPALTKSGPGSVRLQRPSNIGRVSLGEGTIIAGAVGATGAGTLTLSGGTLVLDHQSNQFAQALVLTPGSQPSGLRSKPGSVIDLTGPITTSDSSTSTGVTFSGGGRFRISNRSLPQSGFITDVDTPMEISGTITATQFTGIELALTGRVEGSGTFGGAVGGTLSPGTPDNPVGTLRANRLALSVSRPNIHEFDLAGLTAGSQYDQLVAGLANSGSPVVLSITASSLITDLVLRPSFTPDIGSQFRIIDNLRLTTPVSGTYRDLPEGQVFAQAGQMWRITYLGGTGNDVVVTVVPEPAAAAAGGLLAARLLMSRARRRP